MKLPRTIAERLSEEQRESLEAFGDLLRQRAVPLGLISAADSGRIFDRHVVDSLRAAAVLGGDDRAAVDIGSGAGLPGIPLAIAVPRCEIALVEPKARRAGFLELAVERLGLANAHVHRARAEDVVGAFDVATARAFADLETSWASAHRLLRPGGRLIYFAGARMRDPEDRARRVATPAPPADVSVDPVLETAAPLVIMVRG